MNNAHATVSITSLHSYPVKSARALDHETAVLTERGMPFDREWLVVDARGRFQTQRELPALARLAARADAAALHLRMGDESFDVPHGTTGGSREVLVWASECLGRDCGDEVASWLGRHLGQALRLLRFDPARTRLSDRAWTGDIAAPTAFSDGYPLLVANAASLAALNARLQAPLPMDRFRPNIVVDGLDPWAEDRIHELQAGELRLRLVKPCSRCIIPTTDQATGARGSDEVIRLLRELRFDPRLNGVTFASNAVIVDGVGAGAGLRVGQRLGVTWK